MWVTKIIPPQVLPALSFKRRMKMEKLRSLAKIKAEKFAAKAVDILLQGARILLMPLFLDVIKYGVFYYDKLWDEKVKEEKDGLL